MTDLMTPTSVTPHDPPSREDAGPNPNAPHKRMDIQGLRMIAVVAVILDHLFSWPKAGFIGVDVFFVISGFLITSLLLREYERSGTVSFFGFYTRRFKRIVPAATLVLIATVSGAIALLPTGRAEAVAKDAIAAFFFVSNWRFASEGTDYFQLGEQPSPLQHYWSLSVEEQFYFVWPWLMLALLLIAAHVFHVDRKHARRIAGVALVVIVGGSFAWAMHQTSANPTVAYFSSFTRIWELGIGALVAAFSPLVRIRWGWARTLLAYAGLAGIAAALFIIPSDSGFPAPWAALPVIATAMVIASGIGGEQRGLAPLTNPASTYVGEISYSLYLWHFPVIILLTALVTADTWPYYTLALVLTAVLSVLSFHLVEQTTRQSAWIRPHTTQMPLSERLAAGWGYGALAVASIVCIGLVTAVLYKDAPTYSDLPAAAFGGKSQAQLDAEQKDAIKCVGAGAMVPARKCVLNVGNSLTPSVDDMGNSGGVFDCWINTGEPFKVCHYGSEQPDAVKIALVGDSHAAMLLPTFWNQLTELNWSVDSFAGVNCQWQEHAVDEQTCRAMPKIQERLETGDYDFVFTTTARDRYPVGYPDDAIAAEVASYKKVWEPVRATGTKIIVFADEPRPSDQAIQCVQKVNYLPEKSSCDTPEDEAYEKPDLPVLTAQQVPGVQVLDFKRYFCRDGKCPEVIGNVIVYQDTVGHMTGPYAETMSQFVVPAVKKAIAAATA